MQVTLLEQLLLLGLHPSALVALAPLQYLYHLVMICGVESFQGALRLAGDEVRPLWARGHVRWDDHRQVVLRDARVQVAHFFEAQEEARVREGQDRPIRLLDALLLASTQCVLM